MLEPQQTAVTPEQAAANAAQAAQRGAAEAAQTAGQLAKNAQAGGSSFTTTPQSELAKLTLNQLRARLSALAEQRSTLANRRETIAGTYERATGASRDGIGARLQMLDANIVMYEAEITAVGREVAAKTGARGTTSDAPRGPNPGDFYNEGDIAGAVFGTFFTTVLVMGLFMRRFFRRRYGGNRMEMGQNQPNVIQSNERLDRIEQAVDTIAVEIERVSENQRFMTRLMTETQLGSTINDVRKSAELAKSAAEG